MNVELPIEVTDLPIVTLVRLRQPLNAEVPMVVTLLGIEMFVKPVQLWNAESAIETTELGILTLFRLLRQRKNAFLPMPVTE